MGISSAFSPNRVARGVAQKVSFDNTGAAGTRFRPVRIALVGQGQASVTYGTTKAQVFSSKEVGDAYGYVSPLYIASRILFPDSGGGVGDIPVEVYPLAQPSSGGVAEVWTVTPTGTVSTGKTETHYVKIGNILSDAIVLVAGDTVAQFISKAISAINGVLGMPVTASDGSTTLTLTVGWQGATGGDFSVSVISPTGAEVSLVAANTVSGSGTVSITPFVSQLGSTWVTHVINCLGYSDTTVLGAYEAANEGRWDAEVRKPFRVFTGTNEGTLATVTAITDARKTSRTNIICPNPGSGDIPCRISASWVLEVAKRAVIDPSYDYCLLKMRELTAADDATQWNSAQRNTAVKSGCSTVEIVDGVVCISDTVTTYHPTGEEPPAYRYAVDLEKIDTVIFNTDLIFLAEGWAGAPLIPNFQASSNPRAKKPLHAQSACNQMFDNLGNYTVISDVDYAKENSKYAISDVNPKRLDIVLTFKLSGNVNVISIDQKFGFYFGGAQ